MSVVHMVSMTVQKKNFPFFEECLSFLLQKAVRVSDRLGMLTFQISFCETFEAFKKKFSNVKKHALQRHRINDVTQVC